MKKLLFFLSVTLYLFSCSNNQKKNVSEEGVVEEQIAEINLAKQDIPPAIMERGEDIYKRHCLACHQTDGSGNPGMYPPLDNTKMVNGDKEELIGIIINGLSGEIEVKGEIYNQVMVPHNFLSDREIADLLTYVRNSFGNSSSRIAEEEVASVRANN
jgi:mono/diheme cytochrome c family protein